MAEQDPENLMPASENSGDGNGRAPSLVVALGASAGGLEAYGRFFKALPADTDTAMVLVQHLDPNHQSLLGELIQRLTSLPVSEIKQGEPVLSGHIYVIPPNRLLEVRQHCFQLFELKPIRGLRFPIDQFFRSCAQEYGDRAVAVVLSGTGTDGTLGVRAVKENGGMVLIQDPASAAYDGMPTSAQGSVVCDFVVTPEAMPGLIRRYAEKLATCDKSEPATEALLGLEGILKLVHAYSGHDFTGYKSGTLIRRVERRILVNHCTSIEQYTALLQKDSQELKTLLSELLIQVTSFFRDPDAFRLLDDEVIPLILKDRHANAVVRIWVPGCATGEEAYSLALLIRRHLDRTNTSLPVQIFATDINREAIEFGRTGLYPDNISSEIPVDLLHRYFDREENRWRIKKSVREMLVFAEHSVVKNPPFSQLDLISCRNMLIYLQPELQHQVLSSFHYALNPFGWLFLGSSESLGDMAAGFSVYAAKWRIFHYRATPYPVRTGVPLTRPVVPQRSMRDTAVVGLKESIRDLTQKLLLERCASVAVTVDSRFDILYVQGRTGRFLETTSGEGSLNLVKLARPGLIPTLGHLLRKVKTSGEAAQYPGVRVESGEGEFLVGVHVLPLTEPPSLKGLMCVILEDRGPVLSDQMVLNSIGTGGERNHELEKALEENRQHLRNTVEQLETANEELTATNEELQSSNEELQSTNEELETSQEELRSVNQELTTVNAELQAKIKELALSNDDLANLISCTDLAILFLDTELCIQRFTPMASEYFHISDGHLGRPLNHVAGDFDGNILAQQADLLLDTVEPIEQEIQNRNGRWFLLRLRPYRTLQHAIAGVVLTLLDIHEQKQGDRLKLLTQALEQTPASVIITNRDGIIDYVNPHFVEATGYSVAEAVGNNPRILASGEHDSAFYKQLWDALEQGQTWSGEFRNRRKNGDLIWQAANISPVRNSAGEVTHYVGIQSDITSRRQMENDLRVSEARYRSLMDFMPSAVAVYQAVDEGSDFLFLDINASCERIENVQRKDVIGRRLLECFPGVKEFGLLEVFQRVWRTGVPETHPPALYRDQRILGWRKNKVFRLPTGDIITIYEDAEE